MSFSETWVRNTFEVEAVRVTEENMRKVANWCYGRIYGLQELDAPLRLYIQFDAVGYNKHYAAKAFVGDWVLFVDGHFKHYEDRAFKKAYHPKTSKEGVSRIVEELLTRDPGSNLEDLVVIYTKQITDYFREGK